VRTDQEPDGKTERAERRFEWDWITATVLLIVAMGVVILTLEIWTP
jgi:hypothetical protein